jgi:hypothetical protein
MLGQKTVYLVSLYFLNMLTLQSNEFFNVSNIYTVGRRHGLVYIGFTVIYVLRLMCISLGEAALPIGSSCRFLGSCKTKFSRPFMKQRMHPCVIYRLNIFAH